MANQTYAQLQSEIERLQAEAVRARETEVLGVIERIKEAITVYGLMPPDLFGRAVGVQGRRKATSSQSWVAKYSNGKGDEWVGRGPRPLWLREAIAAGHALEEFAVADSATESKDTAPANAASSRSARSASQKSVKRTAKSFKDPATGKVWTGFGRQPDWLKKALAAGHSLDSMAA